MEQIVDIPSGGLQDVRPGQSSSSSSHVPARVHEDANELGVVFFRTFPFKKVRRRVRTRGRNCAPVEPVHAASLCRAHGSRGGRASVGGVRGGGGPRPMEGRVRPHVVEVGTLPLELVLAWTSTTSGRSRVRVPGGCFWFFEMGVVLVSASFWTTLFLRGYEAAAVFG